MKYLIDTTLRDGEQMVGVEFSPSERITLAGIISQSGVAEMEIGIPAMGQDEINNINDIAREHAGATRFSVWCRAHDIDFNAAVKCNVDAVHLSLPASQLHMQILEMPQKIALNKIYTFVKRAKEHFNFVSIGLQDAARADWDFILRCILCAGEAGADRVRLADTVGLMEPFKVFEMFLRLSAEAHGVELAFHAHNDMGLATANSIAAIRGGAACVDVTVNGLGERAGNATLAQVAVGLKKLHDIDCGISLAELKRMSDNVELLSGVGVPMNSPIVGRRVFAHESGVHVNAMLCDERSYEPLSPVEVGNTRAIVLGRHSGSSSVIHYFQKRGIVLTRVQAKKLLQEARQMSIRDNKSLQLCLESLI